MTIIKIDGRNVDVYDAACAGRECLNVGFDKGVYQVGRGYTKYRDRPRRVCMTRHLHGCPANSICPECKLTSPASDGLCGRCCVPLVPR